MQDRFKFRAKLKDMDKWIYGAYLKMLPYQPYPVGNVKPLKTEYKHFIIVEGSADWGMPRGIAAYEVIPETVGQCTGLKDKNDRLIYEGDIIFNSCLGLHNQISWDDEAAAFMFKEIRNRKGFGCTGSMYAILQQYSKYCEIIGNIHENPELLEDKK